MNINPHKNEESLFFAVYPEVSKWLSPEEKGSLTQVSKLWREVVKVGSVPALLKLPGKNAQSPLASFFLKLFPYLDECSCIHAPEARRDFITDQMLMQIGPNVLASKEIVVQSLGCGGCLRELILSIHLHDAGVKKLHLILLDPVAGIVINNWVPRNKFSCQKKPAPKKTRKSLRQFFKLFLPRLQVAIDWHLSTTEHYLQCHPNPIKPDILLMVDIDIGYNLKESFDALQKVGVIADQTLIGWTQTGILENASPRSFVKHFREITHIKE